MMQRRRPSSPAVDTFRRTNHTSPENGVGSDSTVLARSSSLTAELHSTPRSNSFTIEQNYKPLLPLWLVTVICLLLLSIGFLQHHFEMQREGSSQRLSTTFGAKTKVETSPLNRGDGSSGRSLLTPQEDVALEWDTVGPGSGSHKVRYHLVFSTDCSPYQHWQSYAVFYTAMKVRQPGHITRIASGCETPLEIQAMQDWFEQSVQVLSPQRFHLHLTPKFSSILDVEGNPIGDYKFFNKPYGLRHWMENSELLRFNKDTLHFPEAVHSDVIILIDPDMILLRPITADFSNPDTTLYGPARKSHKLADVVGPGRPFAQVYGFGTQWSRLDLEKIAGPGTPAAAVTPQDGRLYYPAGPPYLAVTSDMYRIAVNWCNFVPETHRQYPHLLAEMFAFSIAAAHLELPFSLVDSLMVSDVSAAGGEGWALVDRIPAAELCGFCQSDQTTKTSKHPLPNVLHMCQRYVIGDEWFFTKRKVPSDIYDCDAPLFVEPPTDLAVRYDFKRAPGGQRFDIAPLEAKRQSFCLCTVYSALNEAASFYKQNACPPNHRINLEKTRSLVTYMAEQKAAAKSS